MSHFEDDDPPIKSHPASKEYRDNWDRIFGEKEPEEADDYDTPAYWEREGRKLAELDAESSPLYGTHDSCGVCGATDHERVEAFGGTVQGCPQVPDGYLVAFPETFDDHAGVTVEPSAPDFVEACRTAEKPWERRAITRSVECSTCGAKNEAPCDEDIHTETGQPIER